MFRTINIQKVPTKDNLADTVTKPIKVTQFHYLITQFPDRLHYKSPSAGPRDSRGPPIQSTHRFAYKLKINRLMLCKLQE